MDTPLTLFGCNRERERERERERKKDANSFSSSFPLNGSPGSSFFAVKKSSNERLKYEYQRLMCSIALLGKIISVIHQVNTQRSFISTWAKLLGNDSCRLRTANFSLVNHSRKKTFHEWVDLTTRKSLISPIK